MSQQGDPQVGTEDLDPDTEGQPVEGGEQETPAPADGSEQAGQQA